MSDPKQRAALLKRVRGEHAETVKRTQALLKKQKKVQQLICQNIRETSKTVPEIAEAVGLETHVVLWNLTVLKKYGTVTEAGMSGEYFRYGLTEEKK